MPIKPRHDRTEPRGWFSLFFAVGGAFVFIAAIGLLIFTGISMGALRDARAFEAQGVTTRATITDRRVVRDHEDGNDYYLTFQFDADGRDITRERKVAKDFYLRSGRGSELDIRYLPDRPMKFETYVGQSRDTSHTTQLIAAVAGLIGLGLMWYYGSRANSGILSRKYGWRTTGTVQLIVERQKSGKPTGKGYMVWRTPDGRRGESLDHPIRKLRNLGMGTEIIIYVRGKDSWWEGDVGPRHIPDSTIPKLDGRD